MPPVDSKIYTDNANITSIKIGDATVERVFVGDNLVFGPTAASSSSSSSSSSLPFGSSGFQWMTMNSITDSTASGIGQNNITVAITQSNGGMFDNGGMYGSPNFPPEYGVPGGGVTIANTHAGIFTAVFSQPITDALVAFASVGAPGTAVPVLVLDETGAPKPFTPIWALTGEPWSQTTYLNQVSPTQYTQFTGAEGFNIIRIDGTMSSVTFNYTVPEFYCTLCFGFVDQNTL